MLSQILDVLKMNKSYLDRKATKVPPTHTFMRSHSSKVKPLSSEEILISKR